MFFFNIWETYRVSYQETGDFIVDLTRHIGQRLTGRSPITANCGNLHTLQAENCCHNSRLVVDEDNSKWVVNEKYIV